MKGESKNKNKNKGRVLRFERDGGFIAKRADSKRAQNDPVGAAKLYRAALEREPGDYEIRLALSDVLTDMRRFTDSNRVLIPYMHEDEYFLKEAYCRVGFNYLGLGCYEAARRCFDRFFELTDEVSERTDAIMDALDFMDQASEEPSGNLTDAAELRFNSMLSEAYGLMEKGSYEEAKKLFSVLTKEQPNDKKLKRDLAIACMCCGDYDDGLEHINSMISEDESDIAALSLKLLHANNTHDEVMLGSVCAAVSKCDPELPEELLPIIGIILDSGRTELALDLARKVYKRNPFDCSANHMLALCYIKLKQYPIAAKLYEKLLNINNEDIIAKYYHSKCTEEHVDHSAVKNESIVHYQLPLLAVLDNIKKLVAVDITDEQRLRDMWQTDPSFRTVLRWGFTIKEFSISYTLINILKVIGDEQAQRLIRESVIDPDTNPTLAHEALGILKFIGAEEPYFAFIDGYLLEGKVNMLDISKWKVPKQYRLIFPRFQAAAKGLYKTEVYAAASEMMEMILASADNKFPPIDEARSTALSAALEYLACGKCGVEVSDDLIQRYCITERRLQNALSRMFDLLFDPERGEEDE